jgi:hypothetical protein
MNQLVNDAAGKVTSEMRTPGIIIVIYFLRGGVAYSRAGVCD